MNITLPQLKTAQKVNTNVPGVHTVYHRSFGVITLLTATMEKMKRIVLVPDPTQLLALLLSFVEILPVKEI